ALAVLGGEALERRRDLPGVQRAFDGVVARVGLEVRVRGGKPRADGAAALDVDDRVARDPVEPGAEARARRIESVGVPPHPREDVLDDLLGELAVAEAVDGEAV